MELLEGNDLEREVELRGPLPISEAVTYVLQAIDAIAEAHAVGIIHRDLKPTNLYLTLRSDGTRVVKVLDFGISKSIISQPRDIALTRTAAFVGSPLFMSPEQMRSARDVDARADIWALGTILYALLTADLPYSRESLPELCVAVMSEPPRPLTALRRDVPPALERVVLKCLARERNDRYASVAELAAELALFAPEMRPYAQRAARVLNRVADSSASAPGLPASAPAEPSGPVLVEEGSLEGGLAQNTQVPWNKSGGRTFMKRQLPMIVATGAAIIGGLVAFLSFRAKHTPASVELHAAVTPSPRAAAQASDAQAPAGVATPALTARDDTDELTPKLAVSAGDSAASPTAESKTSPAAPAAGGMPASKRSQSRVAKPARNSSVAKAGASSSIPNLGGRLF